jgi:hypothetical protein
MFLLSHLLTVHHVFLAGAASYPTRSQYVSYTNIANDYHRFKHIRKVQFLCESSGFWPNEFKKVWAKKGQMLMDLQISTVFCTTETGDVRVASYNSAKDILEPVFNVLRDTGRLLRLLGRACATQMPAVQFYIDMAAGDEKTRPDVAACLVSPEVSKALASCWRRSVVTVGRVSTARLLGMCGNHG